MKILIATHFPPAFLDKLQRENLTYTYFPAKDPQELYPIIGDYEILVIRTYPEVQRDLIDRASKLRLVCRAGIGMDHLDLDYLGKKEIPVFNTQGANADSVGEHTVGMLLNLLHHLSRADRSIRKYQWEREIHRGTELSSYTVGIIGYGNTGRAVARRLASFGCNIIAYDKYITGFGDETVEETGLEDLYARSHILSFHIPLTNETRNWVDKAFFAHLPHPIILLNLSRGKIVHLPSLLEALDQGKLISAGLDVLPNERFDTHTPEEKELYRDLFSRENVLLTPHTGGWSIESRENIQDVIIQRIKTLVEAD